MIYFFEDLGFDSDKSAMKLSFALTGLWWLGFSQYSFYYLPKGNNQINFPY